MDLESLYQEIILDHYKHPRGRAALAEPLASVYHVNPTCGEEVTVQVAVDEQGALVLGYEGQGCSISQASASVMSELVAGLTPDQAEPIRTAFVEMMHAKGAGTPDEDVLGDAVAFAGVAKYPARIKCALLAWMALRDAEVQAGIAPTATDGSEEGQS